MTPAGFARSSFQTALDAALVELRAHLIVVHSGIVAKLHVSNPSSQEELQLTDSVPLNGFPIHKAQQLKSKTLPALRGRKEDRDSGDELENVKAASSDKNRKVKGVGSGSSSWTLSQSLREECTDTDKRDSWLGSLPPTFAGRGQGGYSHYRSHSMPNHGLKISPRAMESGKDDEHGREDEDVTSSMAKMLSSPSQYGDCGQDQLMVTSQCGDCGQESQTSSMFGGSGLQVSLVPQQDEDPNPPLNLPMVPEPPFDRSTSACVVSTSTSASERRRYSDSDSHAGQRSMASIGRSSLEVPTASSRCRSADRSCEDASYLSEGRRGRGEASATRTTLIDEDFGPDQERLNGSVTASKRGSAATSARDPSTRAQPLDLLPMWQWVNSGDKKRSQQSFISVPSLYTEDVKDEDSDEQQGETFFGDRFEGLNALWMTVVVNPTAKKRLAWDLISMLFLVWDYIMIPLQLFDLPDSDFSKTIVWITRIFWTMDVPASFFTGYLEPDGGVMMRPAFIAKKYFRTWFFVDIFVVGGDWAIGITEAIGDSGRLAGTARVMRMFRVFRLMRIMKLPEKVAQVATMGENLWSEQVILVLGVVKIICMVLGCAHLIACFWYGIGKACEGSGLDTWLTEGYFDSTIFAQIYLMSFHWSLAQFVGGTDIIEPRNIWERTYAIGVVLMTFVISAAVVSSLTSSMTRIQFLTGQRTAQLAALRRYLADHSIPRKLMVRVQRNAQHALTEMQRNVPESEVELLKFISEPLRMELHYEEHAPLLAIHPLFNFYRDINPAAMRKVCHEACKMISYSAGDVLFTVGEVPNEPRMYFLVHGALEYHRDMNSQNVMSGWFSEACLWSVWIHRGVMRASLDCRLLAIEANMFQELGNQFQHSNIAVHPGHYAMEFMERLRQDRDLCSDVIDRVIVDQIMSLLTDTSEKDRRSTVRASMGYVGRQVNSMVMPSQGSVNRVSSTGDTSAAEPRKASKEKGMKALTSFEPKRSIFSMVSSMGSTRDPANANGNGRGRESFSTVNNPNS